MIPGDYFPLELCRHAVDSIHILDVIVSENNLILPPPSRNKIISHFPKQSTQYRGGEDVGFGVGDSISCAAQEACRHPRKFFEINSVHTSDFCLFTAQFSSFIE